eukprot:TRINITY_DN13565_c0_g1_i1.p1 TRINITY_DN13565_c0_g1~~TRINITY_DN13565_c0_g1_i1.p1  ORF type:complete len:421 (-),score=83.23 TRINITY_DN13565_c0_g1_i1:704-1927(-)
MERTWRVKPSLAASRTKNPIRAIVDGLKVAPNPSKELISLSIGDPTVFGNFVVDDTINDAIVNVTKATRSNGYPHSCGYPAARDAVAKKFSSAEAPLTANDVILASGASHALLMAIDVLADPGQNILLPLPGFSLYEVICQYRGILVKHYNLKPESQWQMDIAQLESLIDDQTAAILVNNPSNPCGCVYSREHLMEVLAVAERYKLPVIADEIYANMVFTGHKFFSMASLTTEVPILSVGGIAKQYLVPGWRVGWVLIQDRHDRLQAIRGPLESLTQLILGCNSLIQAALPDILLKTPDSYYQKLNADLERHAMYCVERAQRIPGLKIVVPQGAMYVMVQLEVEKFADIADGDQFVAKLMGEESVFVLPGSPFHTPNFFRVVITPPMDKLEIAFDRMTEFCARHFRK